MLDEPKQGDIPAPPIEMDVVALIKRMQQQLVFLEKKIDLLIKQTSQGPLGEERFSKPHRPFGRPHRPFGREHGDASGERGAGGGRRFEKHHRKGGQGFDYKKKHYGGPREGAPGQGGGFAGRRDGPPKGFEHDKRALRYRRKGPR
jgi:hypothetical protein